MRPILFSLGPLHVFGYGAMIVAGGLLALRFLWARRAEAGLADEEDYWLFVNMLLFGGYLGGKALYVLQYRDLGTFGNGFSVFGCLAAVLGGTVWFSRRRGAPLLPLLDHMAVLIPLWHAFGRLGCFLAGCCYGKPTTWPWGVAFRDERSLVPAAWRGVPLHPTQLLESAGDALLAAVLLALLKRARPGAAAAGYLLGYGALRASLELLRGDVIPWVGGLTEAQVFGLAMVAAGAALAAGRGRCTRSC